MPLTSHFTSGQRARTGLRGIAASALAAGFLFLLGPAAQAQLALPGTKAPEARPAVTLSVAEQRAIAEQRLAEAQKLRSEILEGTGLAGGGDERGRLADRLVAAYGDRLRLLDDLADDPRLAGEKARHQALVGEFNGPPPYSALRVEAVREQYDLAHDQLNSIVIQQRGLEGQKSNLLEIQQRAAEGVRLAQDRQAAARSDDEREKARSDYELAELRLKLAEAELGSLAIGLDLVRREADARRAWSEDLQRLIARIRPQQQLTDADLDKARQDLRERIAKLAAESDRLAAASAALASERERLVRSKRDDPTSLLLLDEVIETNRIKITALGHLQTLAQAHIETWRQFQVLLQAGEPAARQAPLAALERGRNQLREWRKLLQEVLAGLRADLREQEVRFDSALLDPQIAAQEAKLLETLKERITAYQRIDLASSRVLRQLERWLADFGAGERRDADSFRLRVAQAGAFARQIWNFELFAVEESTVVDGKAITTSHGVTVGKSIGAVLLYVLCYGLAALLMGRLQRLMVTRFGVEEQVAAVIRRWVMIAVATALVIMTLNLARIPLTVFAFLGGALAIGIGFGTQTIIKNVISGIILLFERKIRVGDIVAIGGTTGYITAVDLRASTVRSFDGVEAVVPNSTFLENQVINWTYSNQRIRREVRVGIAYGSPVREAATIIADCAADHGLVLKEPPPEVMFEDFGDNALLLTLVFWVELSGPNVSGRRVDSDLRFMIEKRLAAQGIQIPFPQRDVHFDAAQPVPVHIVSGPAG